MKHLSEASNSWKSFSIIEIPSKVGITFQKPLEFDAFEFMLFNTNCHSERSAAERRISRKVAILKKAFRSLRSLLTSGWHSRNLYNLVLLNLCFSTHDVIQNAAQRSEESLGRQQLLKKLSEYEEIPPKVGRTFQKPLEFGALPFWNFNNMLSFLWRTSAFIDAW